MDSMTALVEHMASHFGKELTLIYINNTPDILGLDFSTVLQRIKGFRELFGVLDSDVPMMLRKYSGLVALDPQELKSRYDNLRELTRFDNQQVSEGQARFSYAMLPCWLDGAFARVAGVNTCVSQQQHGGIEAGLVAC
jgi:hypothetical protein